MKIATDLTTRVRLGEVHALALMMIATDQVFQEVLGNGTTITSGIDGKHMIGSKHFVGHALDFRTRGIGGLELETISTRLKERLGRDYDVIIEDTHLHVEFDPKA